MIPFQYLGLKFDDALILAVNDFQSASLINHMIVGEEKVVLRTRIKKPRRKNNRCGKST